MTDLLGPNGEVISADSVRAKLSAENQAAVDAKLSEWMGNESEHAAYALEDVRELYKHSR